MKDLVVGVDCSTTASKAIAWDRAGRAAARGRSSFHLRTPRPGWYEQSAEDWWTTTAAALREVVSSVDPARLAAMCVTHQRETFVALEEGEGEGKGHRPLRNAIVWMDERARTEVEGIEAIFGRERIHRVTGKPACVTPSLYKILWLRANEPEVFARACFADVHAYLVLRLTGALRTAVAAADPMGLLDLARGDWADEILAAMGIDRSRLPALVPTGAALGVVTADAAATTGLPEGLPVVAGGGDGQVATLGAGLSGPGRAALNLGTAVVLGVLSDAYVVDPAFRTMAGVRPGTFVLESDLKGGTFTIEWFLERFAGGATAAEMDREAAAIAPGAEGLVLVPYWASVMNPYWDDAATGIVAGWHGGHGRAHFYRAILEGIGMEQRLALEGIDRATGRPVEELVAIGGGARSDLWCRILSDVTGRRIVRSRTVEATCLGAGVLAAVFAGLHPDLGSATAAMTATAETFVPGAAAETYDRLFREVYRPLYPALREPLSRLAAVRARSR